MEWVFPEVQQKRHRRKGMGTSQQAGCLELRAGEGLKEIQGAMNIRGMSGSSKGY